MSPRIREGFPFDEALRAEHRESVVRPSLDVDVDYDPADRSDRGPHVDRVGLVAVDADGDRVDDDPPPEPIPR